MAVFVRGSLGPESPQPILSPSWEEAVEGVSHPLPALRRVLEGPDPMMAAARAVLWQPTEDGPPAATWAQDFCQPFWVDGPKELHEVAKVRFLGRLLRDLDLSLDYGEASPPDMYGQRACMSGRHEQLGIEYDPNTARPDTIEDSGRLIVLRPLGLYQSPTDSRYVWTCSVAVMWTRAD